MDKVRFVNDIPANPETFSLFFLQKCTEFSCEGSLKGLRIEKMKIYSYWPPHRTRKLNATDLSVIVATTALTGPFFLQIDSKRCIV